MKARLIIFRQGEEVKRVDLDPSRSYRLGRESDQDIILIDEITLSRSHLLFEFKDNRWVITCLARTKKFFNAAGEVVSSVEVNETSEFTIPGYRLRLEIETSAVQATATQRKLKPQLAVLVLLDKDRGPLQTYSIDQSKVTVGRSSEASIVVDHPKLSRLHFEISKVANDYFIRDLGSVNGTLLNGRLLKDQETPLRSGDQIKISDLQFEFFIKDLSFDLRVKNMTEEDLSSSGIAEARPGDAVLNTEEMAEESSIDAPNQDFTAEKDLASLLEDKQIVNQKKKRLVATLLILITSLGGLFYYLESQRPPPLAEKKPVVEESLSQPQTPFDRLSPENQAIVKQLYFSAQKNLEQKNFEAARQDLVKLHEIIPFYEDSKALEEVINQSIALALEKEEILRREREKAEIERKIEERVKFCQKKINPFVRVEDIRTCLQDVIEFNPDDRRFTALIEEARTIAVTRRKAEAEWDKYVEAVEKLEAEYVLLEGQITDLSPLDAMDVLEQFLKTEVPTMPENNLYAPRKKLANLVVPEKILQKARARLKGLRAFLLSKQRELENEAVSLKSQGRLVDAILKYREAIKLDDSQQRLVGKHEELMLELRDRMRNIYQEAVLEESIGELEGAKKKWKEILNSSIPGEDYYERSKFKLRSYGLL